jgi:threonine aldolase
MPHDLRSDFLSPSTNQMVVAMANAARAPEGFGLRDDPHQLALEAYAAQLLGKEDALFVPTCTMANLLAAMVQTSPGAVVLADAESHCVLSEAGGLAAIAGLMVRGLPARDGRPDPERIAAELAAGSDVQRPPIGLVVLETTHNRAGGVPLPLDYLAGIGRLCAINGVPLHLDGARLFNAAIAQRVPASTIAAPATTVAISLNKGLCAPAGAILAGPADIIEMALVLRQRLGGGIRPAGALAAAGLIALETMVSRLGDDHGNAHALAYRLAAAGVPVDPDRVETNIIVIDAGFSPDAIDEWLYTMADMGVLAIPFGHGRIRLVTHRGIASADLAEIAEIVAATFHSHAGARA